MDDEQRRREALAREAPRRARATAAPLEQVAIGVDDIGVGRDRIRLSPPAARGDHPRRAIAERRDLRHRIAEPQRAADRLEMLHHARDQPVGAAHREPDAAVLFQFVDERVDRARRHRVAADEQGVERERLAQHRILDVGRNDRVDRSPRLIARERRRRLQHRCEIEEGDVAELLVALTVDAGGIFEEAPVAVDIGGLEPGDALHQRALVVRIIERRAVGPIEAVEGRHRHQIDVVGDVAARERPQFLEAVRIGDDGRPGIEGEAVALPIISPPARPIAALDDRGGDARRLQPDRQREPAESGTDDDRAAAGRSGEGRCRIDHEWGVLSTRTARPTGTGGLPIRTRALSRKVERPA